jgi:uncharacterized protein YjbJ (UPF0337 family)
MEHTERSTEQNASNQDIFVGRWQQMRGALKSWWGRLTDDDFERIGGYKDRLIGMLQEKYGYAREVAQREVEQRLREYNGEQAGAPSSQSSTTAMPNGGAGSQDQSTTGTVQHVAQQASQAAGNIKARAQEFGSTVVGKAGGAITTAGEKISALAGSIRETAPASGTMGSAATAVADTLNTAGSYLQTNNFENMTKDLTDLVRRYPLQSFIVGLGIGYLFAKRSQR